MCAVVICSPLSTFPLFQIGIDCGCNFCTYEVPSSKTDAVRNMAKTSNVGLAGRWMFKLDGQRLQLPRTRGMQTFSFAQVCNGRLITPNAAML
jgi:hypothetical protein